MLRCKRLSIAISIRRRIHQEFLAIPHQTVQPFHLTCSLEIGPFEAGIFHL